MWWGGAVVGTCHHIGGAFLFEGYQFRIKSTAKKTSINYPISGHRKSLLSVFVHKISERVPRPGARACLEWRRVALLHAAVALGTVIRDLEAEERCVRWERQRKTHSEELDTD